MHNRLRTLLAILCTAGVLSGAAMLQEPAAKVTELPKILPAIGSAGPKYYKGNLHTHSLWSDGDDFPEMISDWYKTHDYDFLGLSDHNILSDGDKWVDAGADASVRAQAVQKYGARFGKSWVETRVGKDKNDKDQNQVRLKPLREFRSLLEEPGKFLLVPAEEISASYNKKPIHMNAVNIRDAIQPLPGMSVEETIGVNMRAVAAQRKKTAWRTIVFLNHPNFGWGVRGEELLQTEEVRFFEIYNGHPGVRNYGDETHASVERIWDIALALRLGKHKLPIVYGMATDDSHGYHAFGVGKVNPGRGWIMVKAPYLSADAIVKSMEEGNFYCSSGVTLDDVTRDGNSLKLSIHGEKGVTYKTQFIATMKNASLDSQPIVDKNGKELDVTRKYSDDIGKVVAESNDLNPTYKFTGNELYVRAKVTSSKPHPNPYAKGDVELAWTQPVTP